MTASPKLALAEKKLSPSKGFAGRATSIMATDVAPWSNDFLSYHSDSDIDESFHSEDDYGSEEGSGDDKQDSDDEMGSDDRGVAKNDSGSEPLPPLQKPHMKKCFALEPTNIVVNFEHLTGLLSSLSCQCGSTQTCLERRTIGLATCLFHKCSDCSKAYTQ